MSTPLVPSSEQVAVAWIKAALDLDNNVSTILPDLPWVDNFWLQVMQVGGSPDIDVPMLDAAVSVNAYVVKPNSLKPPWNQASELAMRLMMATYDMQRQPSGRVELDLPDSYGRAVVCSVRALSLPRRTPSDPSQYAVYNLDLGIMWYPGSVVVS